MPLTPYLSFAGTSEEVLEFYRSALGGELEIMRYGGSPAAEWSPPGWEDKVLHGKLDTPAGTICAMDAPPERAGTAGGANFLISIEIDDHAAADGIFAKLGAGGQVTMPLEKTFWSPKFGMLVDKYGTKWIVNCF